MANKPKFGDRFPRRLLRLSHVDTRHRRAHSQADRADRFATRSPINDIKKSRRPLLRSQVEGGCCNEENVHVLQHFREHCDVLISTGDCATMGGIPALRNTIPAQGVFGRGISQAQRCTTARRDSERISRNPLLLDKVYPCHEVVKMDYTPAGCPPSAETIWQALVALLTGKPIALPYELIKYD